MVIEQFSVFEKRQILAHNSCELSLQNVAKKLNQHHSSIDILFKNSKKTENYQKIRKRKATESEDIKIARE